MAVYMDDILVSGNNAQEHLENLGVLLRHLNEKRPHCNLEKCISAQPSDLGHTLSKDGVTKGFKIQHVDAVLRMPCTANRCGNTEIFYGLSVVLRKVLAAIHVFTCINDNRAFA